MVRRGHAVCPLVLCPGGSDLAGTHDSHKRRGPGVDILQQLVNGLSLGALYALIAVGYTVVYGIVQLINFAHGEIFMIGAFGALAVWLLFAQGSVGLWVLPLMLIGGGVFAVGTALLTQRLAHPPPRDAPPPAPPITAVRGALFLPGVVPPFF